MLDLKIDRANKDESKKWHADDEKVDYFKALTENWKEDKIAQRQKLLSCRALFAIL